MKRAILAFAYISALLTSTSCALASPATYILSFTGAGDNYAQRVSRIEGRPYAGWLEFDITNNGATAWNGFYFEIYKYHTGIASHTYFITIGQFAPISSQLSLSLTNQSQKLWINFPADPVEPGEVAIFKTYVDNTDDCIDFGVYTYPVDTPVAIPEPSSILALLCGIGGLGSVMNKARGSNSTTISTTH